MRQETMPIGSLIETGFELSGKVLTEYLKVLFELALVPASD